MVNRELVAGDSLSRGIQKLSKIFLQTTKEIHNSVTLSTLSLRIPLATDLSIIFNMRQKDIHSVER